MVPKQAAEELGIDNGFRAVLFRMVPKLLLSLKRLRLRFRAVLFRMVPKHIQMRKLYICVF